MTRNYDEKFPARARPLLTRRAPTPGVATFFPRGRACRQQKNRVMRAVPAARVCCYARAWCAAKGCELIFEVWLAFVKHTVFICSAKAAYAHGAPRVPLSYDIYARFSLLFSLMLRFVRTRYGDIDAGIHSFYRAGKNVWFYAFDARPCRL